MTGTWDVRSTCGSGGCIATASYVGGSGIVLVSNLVFDQVGGSWVAVGLGSTPCNDAPTEVWVVFTLQPQPDGTLSGETTRSTTNSCSTAKRTVTFTRTGDPDLSKVPDPAALPPRAASPSTALRGRYHETITYANGGSAPGQDDLTVRTVCLRTGDRCMSLFHAIDGVVPLVFSGGKWTRNDEGTVPCNLGGTANIKLSAEYPLPDPLQDPDSAAHRARPQRDDWKRLCRRRFRRQVRAYRRLTGSARPAALLRRPDLSARPVAATHFLDSW